MTTEIASGQQWDAPNGWPQWLGIEGVRRCGRAGLADTARARWLALNRRTYRATGRMMEKYDVVDPDRRAGGGEYPNQDGFGWTNGVALALLAQEGARTPRVAALRWRRAAGPGRMTAARWTGPAVHKDSGVSFQGVLHWPPTTSSNSSPNGTNAITLQTSRAGNASFGASAARPHSSAILMCEEASITDPEISALCDQIVRSQEEEISRMKDILARY